MEALSMTQVVLLRGVVGQTAGKPLVPAPGPEPQTPPAWAPQLLSHVSRNVEDVGGLLYGLVTGELPRALGFGYRAILRLTMVTISSGPTAICGFGVDDILAGCPLLA